MELYLKLNEESKRRVGESVVGGITIGTGVAIERLLHQSADIKVVLAAGGIQTISTFFMALGSISFYDWMVKNFPGEPNEKMKKIAIGGSLATLSGVVNYIGQLKTQGSFTESATMFGLAASGLIIYEYEIIPELRKQIKENRHTILENILHLGNTLGLK